MAQQKKGRKVGRNVNWCKAYFASGRPGVNKAKRLIRTLRRNPNDTMAAAALNGPYGAYLVRARKELRDAGFVFPS